MIEVGADFLEALFALRTVFLAVFLPEDFVAFLADFDPDLEDDFDEDFFIDFLADFFVVFLADFFADFFDDFFALFFFAMWTPNYKFASV